MRKVFFIIPILFIWAYAQVDHYEFGTISSPQNVDNLFAVTITAKDAGGGTEDYTGDVPISTNHGSVINMNTVLFAHGIANVNIEARLATNDMRLIVGSGSVVDTSNSFVVNYGALNRTQILLPGEVAIPGISPGKNSANITSQKSGVPVTGVVLNLTDKWWNVVSVSGTVTLISNDSFAVLNNPHNISNGTKTATITFRTVACPLPAPPIVRDTVSATSTGLNSDKSIVIVTSGEYAKLLQVLPGETNVPGSSTGKTGDAVVTAYKQFTAKVYACDAAWNEAYPIPGDRVTTWCDIGEGKYKTDTVTVKSGGATLHITLYPTPGPGIVDYSIRAVDLDDAAKTSNTTTIHVVRVPDSISVTIPEVNKDTVALGLEMTITATAFGGGQPFSNTKINFRIIPVEGDGTLSEYTGYTDGSGKDTVKFTGTKPGAVYVKALSDLDSTVADSIRFVVITSESISFYPNPWKRSEKSTATILYTLNKNVSSVTLLITDMSGNIVKKVDFKEAEGDLEVLSGPHYIDWDGKNMKGEKVASGMYVIRVRATGEATFKRNALLLP